MFSWEYVDRLLATKSEGVGLIARAISFQDFQPDHKSPTSQTDGRTDGHMRSQDALCTKVSALRIKQLGLHYKPEAEVTCSDRKRGASIKSFTRSKIYNAGENYNLDLTACV